MHNNLSGPWQFKDVKGKSQWDGTLEYTVCCNATQGNFKKYNGLQCTIKCALDDAFDLPMTTIGIWNLMVVESEIPLCLGLVESLIYDVLMPAGLLIAVWTDRGRVFRPRKGVLSCLRLYFEPFKCNVEFFSAPNRFSFSNKT